LDLVGAWEYNPLTLLAVPYIGYHFLAFQVHAFTGRRLPMPFSRTWAIWLVFVAVVAFWVARNLPFAPFSGLAPGS
jgi:hypothetical protein